MKSMITGALAIVFATVFVFGMGSAQAGSGTFVGASKHITTGKVTIIKTDAGGAVVILDKDFVLDGAPDPRVGFGKNGKYDKSTDLGKLEKIKGLQAYVVPASVNPADYNEVYIWCRKFSVPLGVAKVK